MEYAQDCVVEDITCREIGSKVVNLQRCFDCEIKRVRCHGAFDVSGGMGYVLRVAASNDTYCERIIGHKCRHVVDYTLSSRNEASHCAGYSGDDVDYKTHFNRCRYNTFSYCKSVDTNKAAYIFLEADGDKYNTVIGAKVQKTGLIDGFQSEGTNRFINCEVRGDQIEMIRNGGKIAFEGCYFSMRFRSYSVLYTQAEIEAEGLDRHDLTFKNCTFDVLVQRGLGSSATRDYNIRARYIGCDIRSEVDSYILDGGPNDETHFIDSTVTYREDTVPEMPMVRTQGEFFVRRSEFIYEGEGGYALGVRDGGHLDFDEVEARNTITGLIRRYTSDCSAKVGSARVLGDKGGTLGLGTLASIDTNGAPVLPYGDSPSGGTWEKGARYMPAGGDEGVLVLCTEGGQPGVWKGAGAASPPTLAEVLNKGPEAEGHSITGAAIIQGVGPFRSEGFQLRDGQGNSVLWIRPVDQIGNDDVNDTVSFNIREFGTGFNIGDLFRARADGVEATAEVPTFDVDFQAGIRRNGQDLDDLYIQPISEVLNAGSNALGNAITNLGLVQGEGPFRSEDFQLQDADGNIVFWIRSVNLHGNDDADDTISVNVRQYGSGTNLFDLMKIRADGVEKTAEIENFDFDFQAGLRSNGNEVLTEADVNGGIHTTSGDGANTTVSIPHGLGATPATYNVTAASEDAAGDYYVTADATNLTVEYITAAPTGTDNVELAWEAKL